MGQDGIGHRCFTTGQPLGRGGEGSAVWVPHGFFFFFFLSVVDIDSPLREAGRVNV